LYRNQVASQFGRRPGGPSVPVDKEDIYMRKLVSALAITAGLTLLGAPAYAQQNYPPATNQGLTVSESTVSPGESITISGDGAEPGATVTFKLVKSSSALGASQVLAVGPRLAALVRPQAQSSTSLGSTTADGDGSFSATLTIPTGLDAGTYSLIASSDGEVLATATIRVLAASASGALPFTGTDVAPGLAIGASLIVAGGLLLLAVRRRRSSTA
jgi:LPXTG cell wall anchor motif